MKTTKFIALISAAMLMIFSANVAFATSFGLGAKGKKKVTLDNRVNTNQVNFSSVTPLENMRGTASGVSGTMMIDPDNIETSTGIISVKVASMESGIQKRDAHMKDEEWLDADKYPNITYELQSLKDVKITSAGGGKGVATGTAVGKFTLRGVSKVLNTPFTMTYVQESEGTKKRGVVGDFVFVQTDFAVALKDYNIVGIKGVVGSKVGEIITLKASFFGTTGL